MTSKALVLPIELILYAAQYCAQPDLFSLVLLDHAIHGSVTQILYQNIQLRAYDKILAFCRTICTGPVQLRDYPLVIDIHIHPSVQDPWHAPSHVRDGVQATDQHLHRIERFGNTIADMLSQVQNVMHLNLDIFPLEVFDLILIPHRLPYPFMLKSLSIQLPTQTGLGAFLGQQEHIEELGFPPIWHGEDESVTQVWHTELFDFPPDILLRLKTLCVESHISFGLPLMEGRPVSSLTFDCVSLYELKYHRAQIQTASVPLTSLRFSILIGPNEIDYVLDVIPPELCFCHDSLEDLTIIVRRSHHPYFSVSFPLLNKRAAFQLMCCLLVKYEG
ncbi:hypothetical protein FRC12_023501 [Ceratobasidium sp. 428]|nr:hypothetical protein FRC09_005207 [Ceratobasidium sp. 395]KAG8726316.1 hypothetical protein FRC12_023501 [Ceratobasidium sp. 428]